MSEKSYRPKHRKLSQGRHRPENVDPTQAPLPNAERLLRRMGEVDPRSEDYLDRRVGRIGVRSQIVSELQQHSVQAQDLLDGEIRDNHALAAQRAQRDLLAFDNGELSREGQQRYLPKPPTSAGPQA